MPLYKVKLNAWTSPVIVRASSKKTAEALALKHYQKCDCCGQPTEVQAVVRTLEPVPYGVPVLVEIKKQGE